MKKTITQHFLLTLFICLGVAGASAQNTFTGSSLINPYDYSDPDNWSFSHVPTAGEDVEISSGFIRVSIITGDWECHNLTIDGNTGLYLGGGTLTVHGNVVHSGTGPITVVQRGGGSFVQGVGSTYTHTVGIGGVQFVFGDGGINNAGYRDIGSPCGGTVNDFNNSFGTFSATGANGVDCYYSYSPYPNVQVYNESHGNIVNGDFFERWVSATNPAIPLTAGKGFAVNSNSALRYQVLGETFNNGNISYPITSNNNSGTGQGWNLISNPYPSSIDLGLFLATNASTNGVAYVFRPTGTYSGVWGTVNSGGAFTVLPSASISAGQGFFVRTAVPGVNGNVTFTNAQRNVTNPYFFKTAAMLDNEVRLSLSNGTDGDQILAYTDVNATMGYDMGLDADKFVAGNTVSMGFVVPNHEYGINAMNSIDAQTVLPLRMLAQTTGTYTFKADALNTPGLTAYLKDAQNNTVTDLSAGSISVALNGGVAVNGRYSIVFSASAVSGIKETEQPVNVYANDNTIFVNRSTTNKATITVSNILGQQIAEAVTTTEKSTLTLNSNETLQYVIVKVTEGSKVSVAKVLINK